MTFSRVLLLLFLLFIIAYHYIGSDGYYGWDDIHYGMYALQFLDGSLDLASDQHFVYRWGIFLPIAASYWTFGYNDFAMTLPSLLYTLACAITIYRAGRLLGNETRIIALALFSLDYYTLFYSTRPYPDTVVCTFGTLLLTLYFIHAYEKQEARPFLYALGFSLSCFGMLASKETVAFWLPWIVFVLVSDWYQQKRVRFWKYVIGLGLLIGVLYFGLIWWKTGNPLHRFIRMANNEFFNVCSYHLLPRSTFWWRLLWGVWDMFVANGMAIALIFGFGGLLHATYSSTRREIWTALWQRQTPALFWIASFAIMLLSFNFMTTSPKYYLPMCLDGRHFLALIPLGAFASGIVLNRFLNQKQYTSGILLILLAAFATSLGKTKNMTALYGLIIGLIGTYYLISPHVLQKKIPFNFNFIQGKKYFFVTSLVLFLLVHPVCVMFFKTNPSGYRQQTSIVKKYLPPSDSSKTTKIVLTDDLNQAFGKYYYRFDPNAKTVFYTYKKANAKLLNSYDECYVLHNDYATPALIAEQYYVPPYLSNPPSSFQLVGEEGKVHLYRVMDICDLE